MLVDGQRDQIKRVQRAARKVGAEVTIVLDIVHVIEYFWRAAYAFHAAGTEEAETWVRHRLLALLSGRGAGELAKSLRGMVERHELDAKAAAPVIKCTNYGRWLRPAGTPRSTNSSRGERLISYIDEKPDPRGLASLTRSPTGCSGTLPSRCGSCSGRGLRSSSWSGRSS